jgi:hypothetical protein
VELARGPTAACIDLTGDVTGFFRDALDGAMREEGVGATQAAEHYLVELLAGFARPSHPADTTFARPLTLLLAEALEASGRERFERLQALGDGVLYVSGFFADHLETRGVKIDYVHGVGVRAYDGASAMLRRVAPAGQSSVPDLFSELARNFVTFAQLLKRVAEVALARSARTPQSTLDLYQRWLRTGSPVFADALASRGVVAKRGAGAVH